MDNALLNLRMLRYTMHISVVYLFEIVKKTNLKNKYVIKLRRL